MTRDDFLNLLARWLDEGVISATEGGALLRAFDRGEIPASLLREAEPLNPMFRFAAVGVGLQEQGRLRTRRIAGVPLERTIIGARQTIVIRMVESFDEEAFRLARRVTGGQIGVATWQASMRDLVSREMMSNAQLGVGRDLLPSELARLRQSIDAQADYLQRFADQVAARKLRAETIGDVEAYSERYIRARAQQYSGASRAEFYRGAEADLGEGWIMEYIDLDDSGTCGPCREAGENSPYLAGQGPLPGEVCLGRGLCRCRREQVWDPAAYERLTGDRSLVAQ